MINLHESMLPISAGVEPATPGLQSDGTSNWATEAGSHIDKVSQKYLKEFLELLPT